MTVSTTIATKSYDGDGATITFPTVFAFFAETDIEVIERATATGLETVKTLTTDYTVTGGSGAPGSVDALVAPPASVSWTIRRVLSETQETDLPVAGSMPANTVEQMVDRTVMMVQQHSEELGRALRFPKTDSDSLSTTLPSSVERVSKYLGFDSNGIPVALASSLGFSAGTAALPSVVNLSDLDTGAYWPAADRFGITVSGTDTARFIAGGTNTPTRVDISAQDGGVRLQAAGQTNGNVEIAAVGTGTVYATADQFIARTLAEVKILEVDANGMFALVGSAAAPPYSFEGDRDSGMFRVGSNVIGFSVAGLEALRIVGSGGADVNNVSLAARATGFGPVVSPFSTTDTNVDLNLSGLGTGVIQYGNSSSWTANDSVATTLGSLGPAGIGTTTPSKWLTVKDNAGTTYFIPAWT